VLPARLKMVAAIWAISDMVCLPEREK
jgi:hypothetical protein